MSGGPSRRDLLRAAVRGLAASAPPGKCLDEEELVLFYGGELRQERMEAIRDHLVACPACLALARDAREFLDLRAAADRALRSRAVPRLLRLAAALIIAASAGWALWAFVRGTGPTGADPWRDLAIARAEYRELEFRGEGPARPGDAGAPSFIDAMKPYTKGDDRAAEEALARYIAAHPEDHDALFYRGVSLLLLGRHQEAVRSLQTAKSSAEEWVRDQAAWYLALAELKAGDPGAAAETLDRLLAGGKFRLEEAKRLREEIRRAAGR